jgi:glycolate oxidase FAD binding subunit
MTVNHDPALQRLIDQVLAARDARQPLDIRGGGTKDFYGGPRSGEPLELRELTGISSYEPSELVVTVRAGTPLAELEQALAEKGQCLPFEPPRFGSGSVGGMVAAGLSGPARAAVGCVRDYVLGASVLNGQGEVLTFGGQVMKNVAGYDVSRAYAGSMGVLGVILEVSLKVLPLAPAQATLGFEMAQAQALRWLNGLTRQPLPVNASCWHDGHLLLRLRGAQAAVEAACRQLGGERLEGELAAATWLGLRDQQHGFFASARTAAARLWRLSVPAVTPALALTGETLIEWGGAQRWLRSDAPAPELRQAAALAGGHATLFQGRVAGDSVFTPLDATQMRLQQQLKKAFDPHGLFNRGRLYPEL